MNNNTPTDNNDVKLNDLEKEFRNAIDYLIKIDSREFIRLALASKFNGNKFDVDNDHLLSKAINADDYYCSALTKLTRDINKDFERAAFKTVLAFDTELINSLNSIDHLTKEQKIDAYRAAHNTTLEAGATYLSKIKYINDDYTVVLTAAIK